MSESNTLKVPAEKLRWSCDPDSLSVASTREAGRLKQKVIAQDRAVSALLFGMTMAGNDYNIFVAGEARTGLTFITRAFLSEAAAKEPSPSDWCYVYNFTKPDTPLAISLPKGLARQLAGDMDELLGHLKIEIPEVFESEGYRHSREEAIRIFTNQRNGLLAEFEAKANAAGFILNVSPQGMMILPGREEMPMSEEELKNLSDEQKADLRRRSEVLQEEMSRTIFQIKHLERQLRETHKEIDRQAALGVVNDLVIGLEKKFQEHSAVMAYFQAVKDDIIKNLSDFKRQEQPPTPIPIPQSEPDFTRYKINVLIDHGELQGAPVVYEVNPTYNNLFGAMERQASFGALFTDFTMIRPGSLHRANGGYLVIQARDILKWYVSWEALKRALKNRRITIEDPTEMFGLITTRSMKPEPIPLKIKIIMIGEPYVYHLLYQYDEEFKKLFKVKAHLDDQVDRQPEEMLQYISFAARVVEQKKLRHVDKTGLARLLEYGVELAGRQSKLTLKMAMVRDILREADYWAAQESAEMINWGHVEKAIIQKTYRSSLPEDKLREYFLAGYVNLDTTGSKVGQINGLSVYDLGDHTFGRPSRITAAVSLGRQGVVAIDRESKLSGSLHTKGVLIMEGYLKSRYAADRPLSLAASLVFEQSYGMVDGDSASAAELFVLLSRIAGIPLKQSIAVTGAISQLGEIQPIGGVNEKIEGFYDVCQARGLTGGQGVIIPAANVNDLMLKSVVIESVKNGSFTIWAVSRADEALEILTGLPAGQRGDDGGFPEGSFNRIIEDQLAEMADKAKKLLKDESPGPMAPRDPEGCAQCG